MGHIYRYVQKYHLSICTIHISSQELSEKWNSVLGAKHWQYTVNLKLRTKRMNNYIRKLLKTIKSNTNYLDKEYINRIDSSADCNAILRCMSPPVHCCRQILSIYHHIKTLISYHSTSYKWFHILRLQNVIVLYISKHLGSIYKGYIYMTTCVYLTK